MHEYTKKNLTPVVKASRTWTDVCEKFGLKIHSGSEGFLKNRAIQLHVNFRHFPGKGWRRGKSFPKKPLGFYLKENSKINISNLRQRLIKEGVKEEKCEKCGLTKWLGRKPPLELDHINDDNKDNRLKNLEILCANCHTIKTRSVRFAKRTFDKKKYFKTKYFRKCTFCSKHYKTTKKNQRFCSYKCAQLALRRTERPRKSQLKKEIETNSWLALGRKYGVSDNAIRKWARNYGLLGRVVKCRHASLRNWCRKA